MILLLPVVLFSHKVAGKSCFFVSSFIDREIVLFFFYFRLGFLVLFRFGNAIRNILTLVQFIIVCFVSTPSLTALISV